MVWSYCWSDVIGWKDACIQEMTKYGNVQCDNNIKEGLEMELDSLCSCL